jgi:hypothetical protein
LSFHTTVALLSAGTSADAWPAASVCTVPTSVPSGPMKTTGALTTGTPDCSVLSTVTWTMPCVAPSGGSSASGSDASVAVTTEPQAAVATRDRETAR